MDSSYRLLRPSDPEYAARTSPWTSSATQRPALVAHVRAYEGVVDAVRAAAHAGLKVAVQVTGHGAAGVLGADTMLVDTSELVSVRVDRAARTAHVGAGTTWADVTVVAASSGLAGLAGTAPGVGVAGYTFHGGIGWLARSHGLASGQLRSVSYVDADGEVRTASETVDPEALWAFRGGGGVGIATALEFSLLPVGRLWAGYLLWPAAALADVAGVWAGLVEEQPESVSTVVAALRSAPPTLPEPVRGTAVAYLGICATDVGAGRALSAALARALPEPAVSAVGETGTPGLGEIHLDPPGPVPAYGDGRFLTAADGAADILAASGIGAGDGPLGEVEIRHVGTVPGPAGALTAAPAPFLLHATGEGSDDDARTRTLEQLAEVLAAAAPVDSGRSAAALRDGRTDAPGALSPAAAAQLAEFRAERDPGGLFHHPRSLP